MPLHDRDYMRQPPSPGPLRWLAAWTPLHWIIAINIVAFVMQSLGLLTDGTAAGHQMGVSIQSLMEGRFWTAFTYMFVHDEPLHLLGNLLLIWFFGHRLQALVGGRSFLTIYVVSGLVGAAFEMVIGHYARSGPGPDIIGASACFCGILLAYASILPDEPIAQRLYFILPITARLWTLALLLMALELVLGVSALIWPFAAEHWGRNAYFAHIGGALAGWNYVRLMGYGGRPMTYERLWRERSPARRLPRREVARVRRERAMPEFDEAAVRRSRQQPNRSSLPMMDDVDRILEKIHTHGLTSLSDEEGKTLDHASRDLNLRSNRKA